jgi:hypothetical protein
MPYISIVASACTFSELCSLLLCYVLKTIYLFYSTAYFLNNELLDIKIKITNQGTESSRHKKKKKKKQREEMLWFAFKSIERWSCNSILAAKRWEIICVTFLYLQKNW